MCKGGGNVVSLSADNSFEATVSRYIIGSLTGILQVSEGFNKMFGLYLEGLIPKEEYFFQVPFFMFSLNANL